MVFCPYEPENAVLKSKLAEHLKTCPKRIELEQIQSKRWYKKGINFFNVELKSCLEQTREEREDNQLKNMDKDLLQALVDKINTFYDMLKSKHQHDPNLKSLFQVEQIIEQWKEQRDKCAMSNPEIKHANQQNKIVDIMRDYNIL